MLYPFKALWLIFLCTFISALFGAPRLTFAKTASYLQVVPKLQAHRSTVVIFPSKTDPRTLRIIFEIYETGCFGQYFT